MKQYFTSPCKKSSPIDAYFSFNSKLGQLQAFFYLTSSFFWAAYRDVSADYPIINKQRRFLRQQSAPHTPHRPNFSGDRSDLVRGRLSICNGNKWTLEQWDLSHLSINMSTFLGIQHFPVTAKVQLYLIINLWFEKCKINTHWSGFLIHVFHVKRSGKHEVRSGGFSLNGFSLGDLHLGS